MDERTLPEPVDAPVPPATTGWAPPRSLAELRALATRHALLPLRIFLGVTFVYAGLDKLSSADYLKSTGSTSFAAQVAAAHHTAAFSWLPGLAGHAPTLFALLVAFGELAVGLGVLIGLWTRIAAAGGMLLSLVLWLTVSWSVSPYYLGNDLAYLMAFTPLLLAGARAPSVDALLAVRATASRAAEEPEPARRRRLLEAGGTTAFVAVLGLIIGTMTHQAADQSRRRVKSADQRDAAVSKAKPVEVAASSVPVGGAVKITDPDTAHAGYVVQPKRGSYRAFSAICPHAGCVVDAPSGGRFVCPCHGSEFDAATGAVLRGPATQPLTKVSLRKDGTRLVIG